MAQQGYFLSETVFDCSSQDAYLLNGRVEAGGFSIALHNTRGVGKTVTDRSRGQNQKEGSSFYLLWLPILGAVTITEQGHSCVIQPGQVAISSVSESSCILTEPGENIEHKSFHVTVPSRVVNNMLTEPQDFCGLPIDANTGVGSIAKNLITGLYSEFEKITEPAPEILVLAAVQAILFTLKETKSEAPQSLSLPQEKLQRLLHYIKSNFTDPGLTTEIVARECLVSKRYLHTLLKDTGTTFHEMLWQLRMNYAHERLVDSTFSRRTIAEIAHLSGFKSAAHFSRAFRERYQFSPKEVRDQYHGHRSHDVKA